MSEDSYKYTPCPYVKVLLGKKIGKPSRAEIKTNQYREKKGLPPLKKK